MVRKTSADYTSNPKSENILRDPPVLLLPSRKNNNEKKAAQISGGSGRAEIY